MTKRIGIDARLVTYRRGMGNIVYSLLREFARSKQIIEYVIYVDTQTARSYIPADSRFHVRVLKPTLYPVWEQVVLATQVRCDRIDVLFCPANTAPVLLPRNIRLVLTIHDVMYLLPTSTLPESPSLYQRLGRLYRGWNVPIVARRAAAITTVSDYSRRDIVSHLGLPSTVIQVIYPAPATVYTTQPQAKIDEVYARYGLTKPTLLAFGGIDPRKNTDRLIAAFAEFKRHYTKPHQLVIVGLGGPGRALFEPIANKYGLTVGGTIVFLDFVPELDLAALYTGASLVAYPSLYEGFGMPVLEAMACGVPVITSNVTSIPEIAGDGALYVNPTDIHALASGMAELASNEELRYSLVQKGRAQIARYSWTRMANEMQEVFAQVSSP